MAHIDYYLTTLSPFVYLAGARLEPIAARHGATITYKPLDAVALFQRTGGRLPSESHESRREYRQQEIRRQAAKLGVKLNPRPIFWPVNGAPSAYAVIAAQRAGGGDLGGLVQAIGHATWAEDRDISEAEVIANLLAAHGYDPAIADRFMLAAAETYAANLEEAVMRGVFGAPFYLVGDERFWGQDRLDDLDLHLAGKL